MYGFPGQTPARWAANLEAAIALNPEHLSFYGLVIEEGTQFYRDAVRGRLVIPGEDAMADLYEIGRGRLAESGFLQYEVSNFAKPDRACRHNLGYWTDREWLGVGPSAHSYLDGDRFCNAASLEDYHRLVSGGERPVLERETGTPELRAREALAFGLRMARGVDLKPLGKRYALDLGARFRTPIERLAAGRWLVLEETVLKPTYAGLAVADELAMAFL